MNNTERLSEGWVEFLRIHCKEGYLDRWSGDCINNPNNEIKHRLQLNSIVTYWRCNDSKWYYGNGGLFELTSEYFKLFTANEIWDEHFIKYLRNDKENLE
jgi:hypothetical protein